MKCYCTKVCFKGKESHYEKQKVFNSYYCGFISFVARDLGCASFLNSRKSNTAFLTVGRFSYRDSSNNPFGSCAFYWCLRIKKTK